MSEFKGSTTLVFNTTWVAPSTTLVFGDKGELPNILVSGFDASIVSNPSIKSGMVIVSPVGLHSLVFGFQSAENTSHQIKAIGFDSWLAGQASIINTSHQIKISGISSLKLGFTDVQLYKRYLLLTGYGSQSFGIPYLIGGVRYLNVRGFDSLRYGLLKAVNTTADQIAAPKGINQSVVPAVSVSPRILYPTSILPPKWGYHGIGFVPTLKPDGVNSNAFGDSTAWFRVRELNPDIIVIPETGYPVVYDPTQEVQAPSIIDGAIFGDIAIKNLSAFVQPVSINDTSVPDYSSVFSNRRYVELRSIDSLAFGGSVISNKTPSITPVPISNPYFESQGIGYSIRYILGAGQDFLSLGKPTVIKTPELLPKSVLATAITPPTVWHKNRRLVLAGIESLEFGMPTTWFRYRYIEPQSWQSDVYSNQATLTHDLREVIASGFTREAYGTAWVSRGVRLLNPLGIYKIFPANHFVGRHQEIKPFGYIASAFGTRIIPVNLNIYPLGLPAMQWGLNTAYLSTQYVPASGFITVGQQPADRWGATYTYNSVQYIVQEYDSASDLTPPAWSEWTLIENRNKTTSPRGLASLRFGYNKIDNGARQLSPLGISPITGGRDDVSMIAYSIRRIVAGDIEPPAMSAWYVVYNDARIISTIGARTSEVGLASIEKTRRYFESIGGTDTLAIGQAMIAYRVRSIEIEPRYSIHPPQIELPTINNYKSYIDAIGYESNVNGSPSLSIRFNIIAPKWAHRDYLGEPFVKNLTPEIRGYGHDSIEFGVTNVRTQWRGLWARGDTATNFGAIRIADTKQSIGPIGWLDTKLGDKLIVIKMGAPPYSEQKISLEYYGIEFVEGGENGEKQIPKPSLNQNVLYQESFVATKFGANRVWSNNIEIMSGIAIHNVPDGVVVKNKNSKITFDSDNSEHKISSAIVFGKPRLSPHTIYAVVEAPNQAILNHRGPELHYVDGKYPSKVGIQIGLPKVEGTIRTVYARSSINTYMGIASLALVTRIVKPKSFGGIRVGLPKIPFTLQGIVMYDNQPAMTSYGKPDLRLGELLNRVVEAIGIPQPIFNQQSISLWERTVNPIGIDTLRMGTIKNGDKPYMWQGLRVGEHVPTSIGAGDTLLFGESFVSLLIREVSAQGSDFFISEYSPFDFDKRMKVKRQEVDSKATTVVGVIGIEPASYYGVADFTFGQHYIRPDGNSEQFRKGGYHA